MNPFAAGTFVLWRVLMRFVVENEAIGFRPQPV